MNLLTVKTSILSRLGTAAIALRGVLLLILDRTGHSNNITNFALSVLMGAGMALLLIVAWQRGRRDRGQSTDTCAR